MKSERKVYRVCRALVDVEQAQSIERNVQEKPLTRRLFRSTPAESFYGTLNTENVSDQDEEVMIQSLVVQKCLTQHNSCDPTNDSHKTKFLHDINKQAMRHNYWFLNIETLYSV